MPQQMRQPAAVVRIGFMPPAVSYIKGVGEDDFQFALQHVENRLPVRSRAFHYDMRAAFVNQPVPQLLQFGHDRTEFAQLRFGLFFKRSHHQTNHHEFLAHIDAGTSLDDCFNHLRLLADK
jgi:hypothetical protein